MSSAGFSERKVDSRDPVAKESRIWEGEEVLVPDTTRRSEQRSVRSAKADAESADLQDCRSMHTMQTALGWTREWVVRKY